MRFRPAHPEEVNFLSQLQNSDDAVQVVLGVYDPSGTYARHAGVVMASIFRSTRSGVLVHILHDSTLTEQNRARLQETADRFGQGVAFIDVSESIARLGATAVQTAGKFLSVGCLFRLLIPDLLPCEKVIYLDCDVLVNLDIRELWDVDLEGNCIGGVRDPKIKKKNRIFSRDFLIARLIGVNLADYINSGVLVMNLDKIRATCNLAQEAFAYFERYSHCAPPIDQNFINSIFYGKCRLLDGKFNRKSKDPGDGKAILHVMGNPKPWHAYDHELACRLYWNSMAESAWKDDVREAMLDTAFTSPMNHRKTSQCYQKIRGRLYRDVFSGNLRNLREILHILYVEFLFRLRAKNK